MTKEVFVFGSNTAGIHGKGAAKTAAMYHGALPGIGYGLFQSSHGKSFAIPTKDMHLKSLSPQIIEVFVQGFLAFAGTRPDLTFKITRIGCGLANNSDADIAPMFIHAPDNCLFDSKWEPYLKSKLWTPKYWGTF